MEPVVPFHDFTFIGCQFIQCSLEEAVRHSLGLWPFLLSHLDSIGVFPRLQQDIQALDTRNCLKKRDFMTRNRKQSRMEETIVPDGPSSHSTQVSCYMLRSFLQRLIKLLDERKIANGDQFEDIGVLQVADIALRNQDDIRQTILNEHLTRLLITTTSPFYQIRKVVTGKGPDTRYQISSILFNAVQKRKRFLTRHRNDPFCCT